MIIKPLFDKVVLTAPEDNKTISSIIIPSNLEDKPDIAQVYAIGPGGIIDGMNIEMCLKVGDKVLYNKYSGNEFKFENKTYTIIKQSDILAIIE